MPNKADCRARRKATGILTKARMRARRSFDTSEPGTNLYRQFADTSGNIDLTRLAEALQLTKLQLAETLGLGLPAMERADRSTDLHVRLRITEFLEILSLIRERARDEIQALAWYRAQPIPALGGRTPEALVKAGEAAAVRDYIDQLTIGSVAG